MGQKTITVRGRTFAVESKSGNQSVGIIREFEKRTDAQLDGYAVEFEADRNALISAIGFKNDVSSAIAAGCNAILADIARSKS